MNVSLFAQVLVTLKCSGRLESTNWVLATIPLLIVQAALFYFAVDTLWRLFTGRIAPTTLQLVCLACYIIALLLSTAAEIDTIVEVAIWGGDDIPIDENVVSMRPVVLWTITVLLFVISSLVIMNIEVSSLAERRGFFDPQPLSRTAEGWEPTACAGLQFYPLLGYVRMNRPSGRMLGRTALLQSSTDANAVAAASPAAVSPPFGQYSGSRSNGDRAFAANQTINVRNPTTFQQLESNFEIEMPQRRFDPA